MKPILLSLSLAPFILNCSGESVTRRFDSTDSFLLKEERLFEDLHIGEFLNLTEDSKLVTVIRDEESLAGSGLILIDPETKEILELDEAAIDASDIYYSNSSYAYRRTNEIIFFDSSPLPILGIQARRLRGFHRKGDQVILAYESAGSKNALACLNSSAELSSQFSFPGEIEELFEISDRVFLSATSSDGLTLYEIEECGQELLFVKTLSSKHSTVGFVKSFQTSDLLYTALLNENTGQLQLLQWRLDAESAEIETVDGTPFEHYRGMDVSFFPDKTKPGLIYLDAWALKIRIARWVGDAWISKELPLEGATGFYNTFLSKNGNHLRFATHSFRNLASPYSSSFENLNILSVDLAALKEESIVTQDTDQEK